MTINATLDSFYGKPVKEFRSGDTIDGAGVVYRLTQDYDDEQAQDEFLEEFLDKAGAAKIEALVIGAWTEAQSEPPEGFLDALIARRGELGALRALFIGDMTFEECEISWIVQTDYTPLLAAFPALEVLRVRGANELVLPAFEHPALRELAIESGGLPDAIVNGIAQSTLPALAHLELWLGDENYGFGGNLAPYAALLEKIRPERLSCLGLRNAPISDDIAEHVAAQSWLSRLHTLDLSMGTLGDRGANALAGSPHIGGLKRLDVRHHYIGDAAVQRLRALPLDLVIDEAEDEDDGDRYVEVSE